MTMASLSTRRILIVVVCLCVLFVLGFVIGWVSSPCDDHSPPDYTMKYIARKRKENEKVKEEFHDQLMKILSAKKIGEHLRFCSKRPHVGGTPRSKVLADNIEKKWLSYEFDKVEQPMYNIFLPYVQPNVSNAVRVIDAMGKVTFEFSGREKLADPSENDTTMIGPLLGFAKQGSAEGKLLYVNYGRKEDFDELKNELNISDCSGFIVIMRFGKIFRGAKVKHAQDCGANGAILYNDPADYAKEGTDKVYPKYIWLPETGVQRGSIYQGRGDPLTPGLPSIDGVIRIPQDKAKLPKIPAVPMPYGDAVHIMKLMQGREVPDSWKGKLNITYKLGDGGLNNKKVKITVNVPNKRQDAYDVIGTIYGKEEPDRWVMIGNHRDAWGFGAVDACSGTSVMMEISRGLGELMKKGWRPRRTIKFCSWGAEESGLIGSTEWVEENERALATKGITYINVDIAVYSNETFQLAGSPLLKSPIKANVKEVDDPNGNKVYDQMIKHNKKFFYGNLGSGSDYASFYQFAGVPSLDMSYGGNVFYPVYHTVHDTYKWLQGLIDPFFQFHLTTAKVASKILLSIADSLVLPCNVTDYGKSLVTSMETLKKNHQQELTKKGISLTYIEKAIKEFQDETRKFQNEKLNALEEKDDIKIRELNDRMINVEKSFIYARGLPNRPNTKHVVFAPSIYNSYGSTSFPGISDLMENQNKTREDWLQIEEQISVVFKSIKSATHTLQADKKQQ